MTATLIPAPQDFKDFFVTEVEQAANEIEAAEAIPERILKRAAELGVYRLTIPEEFGGWGLSVVDYLPYLEAAASGPGAGRMLMHLTNGVWRPLAMFGNEQQRALVPQIARGETVVAFSLTELAGGTGILIPATRNAAGIGLIALLVAVWPANWYMALAADRFSAVGPAWALWLRVPLQLPLIWWVAIARRGG